MFIDISPLKKNRDFRYLYLGQFVSFFGTMMSMVALPYQVYHLTNSTLAVGLLGVIELVPLLFTAFIGGILADAIDRRKLLIISEIGMAIGCLCLVTNSLLAQPYLWLVYVISAVLSAINGLHRPALDALTPRLVTHEEIQATSVLTVLRANVGMIAGPAVAGISIASLGLAWTYIFDFLTFIFSVLALLQIKSISRLKEKPEQHPSLQSVVMAIKYATGRQELVGTYIVDFVAMVFAMPNALFPAMALTLGGASILGWLYTAPAIGALLITIFSAWTKKIKRHGKAVLIAATLWGTAIACVGMTDQLLWVLFFLGLAGMADSVSGIFRLTIWNETIPDKIRGRMASLEMISYMSGPLLGSAQIGLFASITSIKTAIMMGGMFCISGVILCVFFLPAFWKYRS